MSIEIDRDSPREKHESELRNIVEAVLLVADAPLQVAKLQSLFPEGAQPTREEIETALAELEELYGERVVELRKIGNGYRFQTRERYAPWLRKLYETRPPRFSRALLETLAIIAYRQPVTRGEIEEIRGVSVSSDIIQRLLEREWIRQVGIRDVPGHPALFGTTKEFLGYFNLTALQDLPELVAQRDLGEIARDLKLEFPVEVVDSRNEGVTEEDGEVSKLAEINATAPDKSERSEMRPDGIESEEVDLEQTDQEDRVLESAEVQKS